MKELRSVPQAVLERLVVGAAEVERTGSGLMPRRLPAWTSAQMVDDAPRVVADQTAGVRLDFVTTASVVELRANVTCHVWPESDALSQKSVFALTSGEDLLDSVAVTGGTVVYLGSDGSPSGRASQGTPFTITLRLPGAHAHRPRRAELWLPHNSAVEILGLRADAEILPYAGPRGPRWLHHGSSISHCQAAVGPLQVWPVVASRQLGLDLLDLGLAGHSLLDPFVARTIRDSSADVISVKLGINIVNGDAFTRRSFVPALHGFLDTIRDGHPTTPLLVISPVYCGIHEYAPGPTVFDPVTSAFVATTAPRDTAMGALTLGAVRQLVEDTVRRRALADSNLYLLDGRELLGEPDQHHLFDNVHPDSEGYEMMGNRFAALARKPRSAVGAAFVPLSDFSAAG
ncbi:lipase [Streptomyces sp. NBC_01261]|uniref:SGNH/GDSL hydrolase family protein n=1 Tax=Streptomyces sp. NBC_01261 TaxID=2903802 RepID=UPI002E30B326|nr:SGNH/GDSL hydrolase family protein [Streptomyces sp. NBC_01261]